MALLTAFDYLYQSLRKCGQMRPGYTPGPELLMDGLNEWWLMFDGFNAERTMNYSNPDFVYPVTGPGSQNGGLGYTVGPVGADWTGPRPDSIIRANLKYGTGTATTYIHLNPMSQEQFAALSVRNLPATGVTTAFWYDPQFPNGVFNVFPPLNANSIELFTWGVLAPPGPAIPPTLAVLWSAPPGYADVVVWGLAERLWPLCTKDVMVHKLPFAFICGKAKAAADKVRAVNRPIPKLPTDGPHGGLPGGYFDRFVTATGEPY